MRCITSQQSKFIFFKKIKNSTTYLYTDKVATELSLMWEAKHATAHSRRIGRETHVVWGCDE